MAKNEMQEIGFKDYLSYNENTAGLEFLDELERGGHKISVKGGGHMEYVIMNSAFGYDVFASDKNKAIYANLLQTASGAGKAATVLAYCIIPGSAHFIVKGDSIAATRTFTRVVNEMFTRQYDKGKQTIGYPFKVTPVFRTVLGTPALWRAIARVYGYSPMDFRSYPYNSYAYTMQGRSITNLALGVELDIINPSVFDSELAERVDYDEYLDGTTEKLNIVLEDMRKRYVYPYARMKEDKLALIIGETCVRTGVPYVKLAKKMKVYKDRHDLVVTTVCDFIIRRKCSFDSAVTQLGLYNESIGNLLIETLAEINRVTGYSYDYIINKMMCKPDPWYELLITTFIHLHNAFGWSFAELCQKFHLARDVMYIGSKCGF